MMANPRGRGACAPFLGAAFAWLLLAAIDASATFAVAEEPVLPDRSPRALPGGEPWPGFRPDSWDAADDFPLGPLAAEERWARWQRARSLDAGPAPIPAPPPPKPRRLDEDDTFLKGWERARQTAIDGDAGRCLEALGKLRPVTLDGQDRVRRLAFAAEVALGHRAAADSLFYLLTWDDEGRTGARLAAWMAWQAHDPAALSRALRATATNPGPGEQAAEAWLWWRAHPGDPDAALRDGARVPGSSAGSSANTFLLLAAARSAVLEGDADLARERLRRIDAPNLPAEWATAYDEAQRSAKTVETGEGPDRAEFQSAEAAYLAGDDARALELLDGWLGRWPKSVLRGRAYLYRASLYLDAGKPDRAGDDARAAAKNGEGEVIPRAELLNLFVDAAQGRIRDPQRTLDGLRAGRLGASDEAELLFARCRLERLVPTLAPTGLLQLEEAYPDSPWTERARAEANRKPAATSPPRVALPPAPGAPDAVDLPESGPWGRVLWGDDDLARTARTLSAKTETGPEPEVAAVPPPTAPVHRAPGWTGTVGVGVGARSTAIGEAGVAGTLQGMGLRLRADGVTTQEPGSLPVSQRGGLELGVSGGGNAGWSAVAEAQGRHEGELILDGNPPAGPVSASWWGGRVDLNRDASRLRGTQFAVMDGSLDASGRGTWRSTQGWLRAGVNRPAGSGRWETTAALGYLALRAPQGDAQNLVSPDVKVVRRFASGAYVGARGAYYRRQGLLMPVAGAETRFGGVDLWAATEPALELTPFRETFVEGGDWNRPDFDLPAQRRDLDLRGGVRWHPGSRFSLAARGEWFHAGGFPTWTEDAGWWLQSAANDVIGRRLHVQAGWGNGTGVRLHVEGQLQSVRSGEAPVPYVPTGMVRAQFGYDWNRWYVGGTVLGVEGRVDAAAREYGSFLRWDVETAYRGRGSLEYTLRIENLGNAADRRWPGYPAYGRGIFGGVRALWGT